MNMQLENQIRDMAKKMNVPPGWWCIGMVKNSTCIKVTVFISEATARDWSSKTWTWDCGYHNVICQT